MGRLGRMGKNKCGTLGPERSKKVAHAQLCYIYCIAYNEKVHKRQLSTEKIKLDDLSFSFRFPEGMAYLCLQVGRLPRKKIILSDKRHSMERVPRK